MLLGPQGFQQLGDPAVDRAEAVQPGVASAAEGDQRRGTVGGPAVVDDQRRRGEADAAEVVVTVEHPFPAPAEAAAVAALAVVAGLAPPAAVEVGRSAGAAQRQLLEGVHGGGRATLVRRCRRSSPLIIKRR